MNKFEIKQVDNGFLVRKEIPEVSLLAYEDAIALRRWFNLFLNGLEEGRESDL